MQYVPCCLFWHALSVGGGLLTISLLHVHGNCSWSAFSRPAGGVGGGSSDGFLMPGLLDVASSVDVWKGPSTFSLLVAEVDCCGLLAEFGAKLAAMAAMPKAVFVAFLVICGGVPSDPGFLASVAKSFCRSRSLSAAFLLNVQAE